MLDFKQKIQATETFGKFEEFKKRITLHKSNIERLKDLHHQAEKFGIAYLEQNPNFTKSDVGMVRDVLNNECCGRCIDGMDECVIK